MALLHWTAAAVFVATAVSAQTQPNATARGVIEGTVVNSVTGAPVPDAHVIYHPSNGKPADGVAISESDGHFRVSGVAPGEYNLLVSAKGYRASFDRSIVLGQGALDVSLRLIPLSSLSGEITDQDGNGLTNVELELWHVSYAAGIRELRSEGRWVYTDRQGSFRFQLVAPGRYYLSAWAVTAKQPDGKESDQSRAVRQFYPGTTDPETAAQIDLLPGADLSNFKFRLSKITGVTVGGVVHGSGNADITLIPETLQLGRSFSTKSTPPDGKFELRGVLPGLYKLRARFKKEGEEEWASRSVAVGSGGVEGLELTLAPAPSFNGHFRVDGDPPGTDFSKFVVQLRPADRVSGNVMFAEKANGGGTVRITDLPPGRFRVVMSNLPGFYLKEVLWGGQEIPNRVVDITAGSAQQVEMIVGRNAATVTGSVYLRDPATPFPKAIVVLLPRDKNRAEDEFAYLWTSADDSGRFAIRNAPPGEYLAFAWEKIDVTNNAFMDPAFMASVTTLGVRLSLAEGDNVTVEIPVVPEQ